MCQYRSFLLDFFSSRVQVEHNEQESSDYGWECAEVVRIGREQESLEFVVFVRTDCHSLSLFDEGVAWFLVVDLELIDSFFLRGLN